LSLSELFQRERENVPRFIQECVLAVENRGSVLRLQSHCSQACKILSYIAAATQIDLLYLSSDVNVHPTVPLAHAPYAVYQCFCLPVFTLAVHCSIWVSHKIFPNVESGPCSMLQASLVIL